MKNTVKLCIITLVLGMLLAFVIFTLFANRILTLDTDSHMFDILIGFACILLAALLLGILAGDYSRLQRAYSCCGLLSMLGGTGLVLTAFLTSLSPSYAGIPFSIGIALCFFFLVLFLGGLICLLQGYFSQTQYPYAGPDPRPAPRSTFRRGYESPIPETEGTCRHRPVL